MSDTRTEHEDRVALRRRQQVRAAATVTVVGGSLVVNGQPANAVTFDVINTNASGPGSLTQAILDANASSGPDTITFSGAGASGTITIDGSSVKISDDLTILGPGAETLTLTNTTGSVLYVYNDAALTVSDVSISSAGISVNGIMGADGGDLMLTSVVFDAPTGRAIEIAHDEDPFSDDVALSDVQVEGAGFGGIEVRDVASVSFDTVTVTATGGDGAQVVGVNNVTVSDSMFANNDDGGALLLNVLETVSVTESIFAQNGAMGLYVGNDAGTSVATIAGVDSFGNGNHGVFFNEAGLATISNVRSGNNDQLGMRIAYSYGAVSLSDIVVSGNLDGGLYVERGSGGGTLTVDGLTDTVTVGAVTSVGNGDATDIAWSFYVNGWDGDVEVSNVSITGEFWIDEVGGDVSVSNTTVSRNFDGYVVEYPQFYIVDVVGDVAIDNVVVTDSNQEGVVLGDVGGETTVTNMTVSGSGYTAVYISEMTGPVTMTNITIADNDVAQPYAMLVRDADVTIAHSTISNNSSPGGAAVIGLDATSNLALDHSIVAGNNGDFSHAGGASTTAEFSLVETGSGLAGTNIETTDPDLAPLGDFGGATPTMRPNPGSPALDAGDPAISAPPPTDQRGGERIAGTTIDIGAVEVDAGTVSVADVSVTEDAGTVDVVVTRSGAGDGAASVTVETSDGSAVAPADYTATSATVTWADGETGDKTVVVPIAADTEFEDDEVFEVTLSAPTGVSIDDGTAEVTIVNVAAPVISPLAPQRYVDTRPTGVTFDGNDQADGKLNADDEITIQIAGRGGVPADAVGVVMNVTAVQGEGVGFLTAHACEPTRPDTSVLNFEPGVNLGNEIIAGLDADGEVCIYTSAAAHVTVDVVGYVPAGSPFTSLTPKRLLDTRATGQTDDGLFAGDGAPGAGQSITLDVAGRGGVPADARTVVVNVTAVRGVTGGFVTVSPCSDPLPGASSLNHLAGTNRANELVASLNDDGELCLFTSAEVDVLVDVVAYFETPSSFTAVEPSRLLDTRPAGATVDQQDQRTGKRTADSSYTLQIEGRVGIPASATAVIVNVTAVGPDDTGFVTVHPCLPQRPLASSLNFVADVNGPNEIVATLSADGEICLYTSESTHLLVDVVGYLE